MSTKSTPIEQDYRPYAHFKTFNFRPRDLIVRPFIAGCMLLALYTTSYGFSKVLSGGLAFLIVNWAMSALLR